MNIINQQNTQITQKKLRGNNMKHFFINTNKDLNDVSKMKSKVNDKIHTALDSIHCKMIAKQIHKNLDNVSFTTFKSLENKLFNKNAYALANLSNEEFIIYMKGKGFSRTDVHILIELFLREYTTTSSFSCSKTDSQERINYLKRIKNGELQGDELYIYLHNLLKEQRPFFTRNKKARKVCYILTHLLIFGITKYGSKYGSVEIYNRFFPQEDDLEHGRREREDVLERIRPILKEGFFDLSALVLAVFGGYNLNKKLRITEVPFGKIINPKIRNTIKNTSFKYHESKINMHYNKKMQHIPRTRNRYFRYNRRHHPNNTFR